MNSTGQVQRTNPIKYFPLGHRIYFHTAPSPPSTTSPTPPPPSPPLQKDNPAQRIDMLHCRESMSPLNVPRGSHLCSAAVHWARGTPGDQPRGAFSVREGGLALGDQQDTSSGCQRQVCHVSLLAESCRHSSGMDSFCCPSPRNSAPEVPKRHQKSGDSIQPARRKGQRDG